MAAKYSAVSAVAAMCLAALILRRFPWRGAAAVLAGALIGFIEGGPYIVIKPRAFYDEISRYMIGNSHVPAEFTIPAGELFALHAVNLARFSIGLPAFLLAIGGIAWMLRRRAPVDWIIFSGIVGYAAILVPLRWALIRYDLPLALMLGLCGGFALERLSKPWRYSLTAAALAMPLAGCFAQIHYMRAPHPANTIMERILAEVPPGAAISRRFRESPPLDEKIYPLGPSVFMGDLAASPPAWVLMADLPDSPYKPSTLALLHSSYSEVAHANLDRTLGWATLGEWKAPHDWKYTHPRFTLYRRKPL
jgi:hypothetical protein